MSEEAIEASSLVLRSGYIGQGERVEALELALQAFVNNDLALTTNSATSAESLIYHLLKTPATFSTLSPFSSSRLEIHWRGLSEGDEVLACPLTCTATNWPIVSNGISLRWVDTCRRTLGPDLDDLRRKLSPRTRIISIVHWGGYPVDLRAIYEIQNECFQLYGHWPLVIEDCAHALGSKIYGERLGSHGNICTFSLQAIKHVTSVDGGFACLNDQKLYNRFKLLRWYGIDRESNRKDFRCEADITEIGFKYHMNDVCAAIGLENLRHYQFINDGFSSCAKYYSEKLAGVPGLTLLQTDHNEREVNPWLFSLSVENKRDFYSMMHSKGIAVSQVHERNDKHSCVKQFRKILPNLDYLCDRLICIPCGWWVSPDDREYIVDTIKQGW